MVWLLNLRYGRLFGPKLAHVSFSGWPISPRGESGCQRPLTDSAMRTTLIVSLFLSAILSATASAQVTLKRGAVVYTGSAANTTAPATVNEKKVRAATPEWQKIEDQGIDPQSARGKQLITRMNSRISKAVKSVADSESKDLVTRNKDMKDDRGRTVTDLTSKVVAKIEE